MNATTSSSIQASTSAAANTAGSQFYDFLVMGTGLVSRIREVTGKRKSQGRPSIYCTISVPLDPKGSANTRWSNFDVRVCGIENIDFINSLRDQIANNKRPAIHFTVGDVYGDSYEHSNEVRAQFKGRLIRAELAQDERRPLKAHGLAYVNANRMDTSASVQSVFNLSVVHGPVDAINYTFVNAKVADSAAAHQARDLICEHAVKDSRILVGFEMSQLAVQGFRFGEKSPKAGQLGTDITARLEGVRWIRLNGQVVYKRPATVQAAPASEVKPDAAAPAAASLTTIDNSDGDGNDFVALYSDAYISGQD